MTTLTTELNIEALPKLCQRIPSLPVAASKFVQICRSPDADIRDLTAAIELDPALASRILQVSNSAAYNRGREVTTLQSACMVLGLQTLKVMALSFSLRTHIADSSESHFDLDAFWRRSLLTSVASRGFARLIRSPHLGEAFFCGLISQIGQFALARIASEDYARIAAKAHGVLPTAEEQRELLPLDHHDVGAELLSAWEMPELFSEVTRGWESPDQMDETAAKSIAQIVGVADALSQLVCDEEKGVAYQRLYAHAELYLGLAKEEVDIFVASIEPEVEEMSKMLNISFASNIDMQSLLDEAHEQLLSLTIAAAVELEGAQHLAEELTQEAEALRHAAQRDALTGIPNRGEFDSRLQSTLEARLLGSSDKSYGLIMIDVDHFKRFNDTHGHQAGDRVLQHVAQSLNNATRTTDFAARYGGEEFVVVIPNATGDEMQMIGERIRKCIESSSIEIEGVPMQVTVSVGVAFVEKVTSLECGPALLKAADDCLYAAKKAGRNRVVCLEATL